MKKVITLLLAAGLVIGAASAANAVDIKAKGLWHNAMSFADRNFEKHNGSDKMQNATRIRTQIDVIASESLKGVVYFEIGPQNWGKGADGASLALTARWSRSATTTLTGSSPRRTPRSVWASRTSACPDSPFRTSSSAAAARTARASPCPPSSPRTSEPPSSGCAPKTTTPTAPPDYGKQYHYSDAMDFTGITLPLKFDGVKVTPWAMYGFVGRDSFENAGASGDQKKLLQGLLPLGVSNKTLTATA